MKSLTDTRKDQRRKAYGLLTLFTLLLVVGTSLFFLKLYPDSREQAIAERYEKQMADTLSGAQERLAIFSNLLDNAVEDLEKASNMPATVSEAGAFSEIRQWGGNQRGMNASNWKAITKGIGKIRSHHNDLFEAYFLCCKKPPPPPEGCCEEHALLKLKVYNAQQQLRDLGDDLSETTNLITNLSISPNLSRTGKKPRPVKLEPNEVDTINKTVNDARNQLNDLAQSLNQVEGALH